MSTPWLQLSIYRTCAVWAKTTFTVYTYRVLYSIKFNNKSKSALNVNDVRDRFFVSPPPRRDNFCGLCARLARTVFSRLVV
jgi:hypothetical protein